jgi:hypothetical protein
MSILQHEMQVAAESQEREAEGQAYDVYINDYGNYGNWYDCSGWH